MCNSQSKLLHNYHELDPSERQHYNEIDRMKFTPEQRFFFEGSYPIPGQMYLADRRCLYDTIIKYKPGHCFEVGTGSGGDSTFFLASAFAKLGRGKVITLEIDRGSSAFRSYRQFEPQLLPFVEFLTGGDPALFLPFIKDGADCVFLDGSDDSEETLAQYVFFKPYFRPGSILMAHDWNSEKMRLLTPILKVDSGWAIEVELGEPESVGFVVARYRVGT